MATKKNKVKFNICNVHYALITVSEEGEVTFGTPVAMPGAVSLSLEPNGEPSNFYADGYAYYTISNNMGDGAGELSYRCTEGISGYQSGAGGECQRGDSQLCPAL